MKKLTHVSFRDDPAANNAFIGAQLKLDEVITRLSSIRFNMADCQNWAHAEGACHDVNRLVDAANEMIYLVK
jgi:hypothetical protein